MTTRLLVADRTVAASREHTLPLSGERLSAKNLQPGVLRLS
ncbi:hypothetical protein [Rathayibacter sp. Leaf296]|nr:hypothetical protein [Rathayibacter sp. Leaf296]